MEEEYRKNLIKSFKKQIDNCHYSFIIVDAINNKVGSRLTSEVHMQVF